MEEESTIVLELNYNTCRFIFSYMSEYAVRSVIVFGEDRLRGRGSLPAMVFFIKENFSFLANDNSRKFKQN